MKKDTREKVLVTVGRLLIAGVVGLCISIIFIYLLFKSDRELIALLFEQTNALAFTLVIVSWFFGAVVGTLVSSYEFIGMYAEKLSQLDEAREEISSLKARLKVISTNRSLTSAERVMAQFSKDNPVDDENPDIDDVDSMFKEVFGNKATQSKIDP